LIGDRSSYDGSTFAQRSVGLGEPVIYVTFNYRVNAFGWLAGKEDLAGETANVGLHDRESINIFLLLPAMVPRGSLGLNRHFGYLAEKLFLAWIQAYVHISPVGCVIRTRSPCDFFFPTGPSHIITSDR